MSQSAISRIWRAFGRKPHLVDTFKLATDPQVIDKVRDLVALYLHSPEAAMVLCVDEKMGVPALDGTARCCRCCRACPNARPMTTRTMAPPTWTPPGPATAKVVSQLTARHRAVALKRCLAQVDRAVPAPVEAARG